MRAGITTAIRGKNNAAWRPTPPNGRERIDRSSQRVRKRERTSGVDGKPTLRMKLNAPTVPPTPPVASRATTHPLGASHSGYDTFHWTGSLLLEEGTRHYCRGSRFSQRSRLVWCSNTSSNNYRNVQVSGDLFDHARFYRMFRSTSSFKVDESHPQILRGKGVRGRQFRLRIRNSVRSSDRAYGGLLVSYHQVSQGNRFELEPLDRRSTFRFGTDQQSRR